MSARNSSSTNNLESSVRLNLLASFDAESEHSRQQRINNELIQLSEWEEFEHPQPTEVSN